MPVKKCLYASCGADSRKMKDLGFARFVDPSTDRNRAQLWVEKLSRPDFTVENISRYSVLCEKHFPDDTLDFDYRTNLELTPLKEGTPLSKVRIQPYYRHTNQEIKKVKTYEKLSKGTLKYVPVYLYHGVRSEAAKIDFEGNF